MDRRIARIAAAVAMLLGACLKAAPVHAENRIALVIGNSDYQTISVLPNPANDARAMTSLLREAGFEIVEAPNQTQAALRRTLRDFAAMVAEKGPDTVTLVYYAGHGLQVDGENFLVPVDADIKRESDVPIEAVRLLDVMNALASVPSRTRIVILDACRNNPFAEIRATTGRGLAIVDAPTGSIVSYSTAPGMVALDGDGENSPFTAALVEVAKEPGLPIEQAFKRVRLAVHKSTKGEQTPWESSSLTGDFAFFPGAGGAANSADSSARPPATLADAAARRQIKSVQQWRAELKPRGAQAAYEIVIREDVPEAYEAYLALFSKAAAAPTVRALLERRREMIAWYTAMTLNTADAFRAFLADYPNSDLAATARKLLERARNRSLLANALAVPPARVAAVPPACTCPRPSRASAPPTKKREARPSQPRPRGVRPPTDEDIFGPSRGSAAGAVVPFAIGVGVGLATGRGGGGGGGGRPTPIQPSQHNPNYPMNRR